MRVMTNDMTYADSTCPKLIEITLKPRQHKLILFVLRFTDCQVSKRITITAAES